MANVHLTKDDGELLSVPAGSVTAILTTALDAPDPDRPNKRSVILTNYRGVSTYLLSHSAQEARALIDGAAGAKRKALITKPKPEWLELDAGEDKTFLAPGSVQAYEGVRVKPPSGEEDVRLLRVQFTRHDGTPVQQDVDHSDENLQRLDAAIEKGN